MASPPDFNRLTVRQAVGEYLHSLDRAVAGASLSPKSVDTYRRDMAELLTLCDPDGILDDLTADDIDSIILGFSRREDRRFTRRDTPSGGKSPGTTARFRQSLSRLFTYSERRGYLRYNPFPDTMVKPKTPHRASGARSALSLESATALAAAPTVSRETTRGKNLALRDELIIRILLETGPRVSELCAFNLSDVEHRDGTTWLLIRNGKGGKPRTVPLSPSTATFLERYLKEGRPQPSGAPQSGKQADSDQALLLTFRGRRMASRDVQNLVKRLVQDMPARVRRDATPHALRHTMATLALESGSANVSVIQKILGHASMATTGLYLDEIREELARSVADNPITGRRT